MNEVYVLSVELVWILGYISCLQQCLQALSSQGPSRVKLKQKNVTVSTVICTCKDCF